MNRFKDGFRSSSSSFAIVGLFIAILIAGNVFPASVSQADNWFPSWHVAITNISSLLAAVATRENNNLSVLVWVKGKATDDASSYVELPLGSAVAEIGFQAVGAKTCRMYNGPTEVTTWDITKTSNIQTYWKPAGSIKLIRRVVCSDGINTVEDQATIVIGTQSLDRTILCAPAELGLTASGSNFNLSSVGNYNETGVLLHESVKPPFVEILTNPTKVRGQLQKMYDNGQRKIALVMWHAPFRGGNIEKSSIGYLVNSQGGLKPDIIKGLEAYYTAVRDIGFTDVVFRAGLQSCSRPDAWVPNNTIACPTSYSTEIENENFTVLMQAHAAADKVFASTTVKRWYDLFVEGIGWAEPGPTYNKRIWKRYTTKYGTADTFGFSIAYAAGRLTTAYGIYDSIGKRPAAIAVDIYDSHEGGPSMTSSLNALAAEMRNLNLTSTPVVIQETYYNHAPSFQAISGFIKTYGIHVAGIYQWQDDKRNVWVDTPYLYSAYCPALPKASAAKTPSVSAWIKGPNGSYTRELTVKVNTHIPEMGFQGKNVTSCKVYNGIKEFTAVSGVTQRRAPFTASAIPWKLVQKYVCTDGRTSVETSVTLNIVQ